MRTEAEIAAKAEELFDRAWYQRHIEAEHNGGADGWPSDIREQACAAARRVEAEYDVAEIKDAFECGVLFGRLAAVRWVLDADADENDECLMDT
jgi:hypothetical protein